MINSLRSLSGPSEWPEWPNDYLLVTLGLNMLETWLSCLYIRFWAWELRNSFGLDCPFMAFLARKIAIFVTFCFQQTRDWVWCLFPAFWAWEIHWAHFQVPQIDLNGQIIHLSISGRWWWFPKNQSALARHATVNRSALTHLATVNCSGLTCQATMNHSVVTFQKLRGRSALTFQTLRGRSVAS